jgi:predicted RNA binding protein YcfA (HicA-like mRNA interferase family)
MTERIGASFRLQLLATLLCGVLVIAGALLLIARGELIDGLLLGGAATLMVRWYWRATARNRALLHRGFHTGRRVGSHWAYEELHDGVVATLELPLEYVGRGGHDIHIPSEHDWRARMPPWARDRREEIVERLQHVFKRSQIHFDADAADTPPADA